VGLTPTTRNKWTSGWDGNWFYYRVPSVQIADFLRKKTYPLRLKMMEFNYFIEVPSSCGTEDANFVLMRHLSSGVTMW
jgi:hypothetical protein